MALLLGSMIVGVESALRQLPVLQSRRLCLDQKTAYILKTKRALRCPKAACPLIAISRHVHLPRTNIESGNKGENVISIQKVKPLFYW